MILVIGACLIGAANISTLAANSIYTQQKIMLNESTVQPFLSSQNIEILNSLWASDCNQDSEWIFGSESGPQLWHITDRDAWSGDFSLGCFDEQYFGYANNMNLNYALANITLDMRDVLDMRLDFYCKYITEDSDDHWGIVIYDPELDFYLPHRWDATYTWQQLPYETYGYHPLWMGEMQPMGEYQSFGIKAAYDHWYDLGFFRHPNNGSRSYSLQIGFMMYQTDESGYTNDEAQAHGDYWSGVFIDDVSIKQLVINSPPDPPSKPNGPDNGYVQVAYTFSTSALDQNDDTIRYGWDWNNDNSVDEWTSYYDSGVTIQRSHMWNDPGQYQVKVLAEDEHGDKSDFSLITSISISDNIAPNTPERPTGPENGKAGVSYTYQTVTTDPNSDTIYYLFDWGNGNNTGWNGPYDSGDIIEISYIWTTKGDYDICVKAKDDPNGDGDPSDGLESSWSESLSISMPKYHVSSFIKQRWSINDFLEYLHYLLTN